MVLQIYQIIRNSGVFFSFRIPDSKIFYSGSEIPDSGKSIFSFRFRNPKFRVFLSFRFRIPDFENFISIPKFRIPEIKKSNSVQLLDTPTHRQTFRSEIPDYRNPLVTLINSVPRALLLTYSLVHFLLIFSLKNAEFHDLQLLCWPLFDETDCWVSKCALMITIKKFQLKNFLLL